MNLVGDIGGTKTLLAFSEPSDPLTFLEERRFSSQDYDSLREVVSAFLKDKTRSVDTACFAVAGPVINRKCQATNLPWVVDAEELEKVLGIPQVILVNDLEAMAFGCLELSDRDLSLLNAGSPDVAGHRAVVAAGTGLGEAILFWDGQRYRSMASEGGHTDFGPRNRLEIRLLNYLTERFEHVSYERILSGPGLLNLYEFMRDSSATKEVEWVSERLKVEDPGLVITECALGGQDDTCERTLDLFVSLYGAEAGNLALKSFATGGIYIGGGIAPKILEKLKEGSFMKSFCEKGRYSEFLKKIPVWVVLNERTALLGAARLSEPGDREQVR